MSLSSHHGHVIVVVFVPSPSSGEMSWFFELELSVGYTTSRSLKAALALLAQSCPLPASWGSP
eukprot:7760619-Prorocentrum_lima.AAC.1